MARRRKSRSKRRTRRKVRSKKGSDESDKDYKVGRDEEVDESDEYFSLDEFDEVDEINVTISTSKSKGSFGSRKENGIKKRRIAYKEDDDYNYHGDEDDDEEFIPNEFEDEKKGSKEKRKVKKKNNLLKKPTKKKTTRKKSQIVRRTQIKSEAKPSKRKRLLTAESDSDSDSGSLSSKSCDYKYTISEEEREQVREANRICSSSSNRLSKRLKNEVSSHNRVKISEKGKEKVSESSRNHEICGICLSEEQKLTAQRGKLDSCDHYFCFTCIIEWSKIESRCPTCKQRFTTIRKPGKSRTGLDLRTACVRVPERNQVYQPSEEELNRYIDPYENILCNECQQGGDDALMLLCDICDSSAHTYCVGLGLEIPEGNWYCEACKPSASISQSPNSLQIRNSQSVENVDVNSSNYVQNTSLPFRPASPSSPAFTLQDRRRIQSQIRVIINNRGDRILSRNSRTGVLGSQIDQSSRTNGFLNSSRAIHAQNENENEIRVSGPSFLPLNLEKEKLQQIVRKHLKALSGGNELDYQTFKDVARSSTHTILAACGLDHRKNEVYPVPSPPSLCNHDNKQPSSSKGFCSDCFDVFVGYVVKTITNARGSHTVRV